MPPMPSPNSRPTAAVATPHPAAAEAARGILLEGGNAVDAAVGAMLACCVAMPGSVGLGGYGGSMVAYLAREQKIVAIDFDSRAPFEYRPEAFSGDPNTYATGYLSITVPAVVAGLDLAARRFGSLSWAAVSQPAIALATQGVAVTADLNRELENWAKKTDPTSLRAWFPGGAVPAAGAVWVQPDMTALLHRLADEGPEAFYHGDIPRTIVRQVRQNGGILAEEDFARYQPEVVEPLAIDYRGYRVLTPPPPSGGLTSLQILKTLETFELAKLPPWGAEYFHQFAEAAKRAWHDRARYLGDPDVTPIPVDRLLKGGLENGARRSAPDPAHTVNVLAADSAGNVVSMTATQGGLYGSSVVIDGLGLVMGHGMSRFDLAEVGPNAPAAGKRMLHNMAPTVILGQDGRARGAVGLPGGRKIVTVTAQLVVSLLDFGVTPAMAISAGRVHIEANEPVAVSASVPTMVIDELTALGHTVRRGQDTGGPPDEIGGTGNALWIDPDSREVAVASQANGAAVTVTVDADRE
jgi:gamma-glutamyltranspeptidase/glutathione hydrolase